MAEALLEPAGPTFLGLPQIAELDALDADAAIVGIPHGTPYELGARSHAADAPAAVRARSERYHAFLAHHDFDFDGPLLGDPPLRVADCGDVGGDPHDPAGNARRAGEVIAAIRRAGAAALVLGGDDSVPIGVLRGYEGSEPFQLIQIDAHLDFRDEVAGVREGYSSTMRRASELPWVERIVHVGMRGVGSSLPGDVHDTLAAGNAIVPARAVRRAGIGTVLEELPAGATAVVSIDLDGLDPAAAPGVVAANPGGLAFDDVAQLVSGVGRRCRLLGVNVVEYAPDRDVNGLTSLVAVRLLCAALGALARTDP